MEMTKKKPDAFDKYYSCAHRSGKFCLALGGHMVGINGFSIQSHCGPCRMWEKSRKGKEGGER